MTKKNSFNVAVAVFLVVCISNVSAHSGGLNGEGCHNNRKTGDYHCHHESYSTVNEVETDWGENDDDEYILELPDKEIKKEFKARGAFRNCAEARAAGAAPVRRNDPGYGPHLDRDGDGVACEPYRKR